MFNYQTKTTRMKKNVLMLGLAAIAFTACTNEEVTHFAENRAIGFDTFVGKNTKAVTEMNTTGLQTGGFYVWGGYETDTDIFAGTHVTYTNGNWGYTPLQYWESGKAYRFAAFSADVTSATPTFNYDDGHVDLTSYTADINNPVDLVYAHPTDAITAKASGNQAVQLSFGHVLSWVKLTFINGFATGTTLTISDITVEGVKTTAAFTDGAFKAPTTDATMTAVTLEAMDTNQAAKTTDFTAIPQTIDSFVIKFNISVTTAGGTKLADNVEKTATIATQTWAANNIYEYKATIDGATIGAEAITFDPSVTTWGGTTTVDNTTENSGMQIASVE